tara:strand:+ start:695 stop:1726 length:1032 start_codon:yes stop_codon:yes gene_type:complete
MSFEKITRPTKIQPLTREGHGCKNGWIRHMGSDYPCGSCQDTQAYRRACKFYQVDPETLLGLPVPEGNVILWRQPVKGGSLSAGLIFVEPGDKLTELMVQGWEFVPRDIYEKRDEAFVEANPHLAPLSAEELDELTPVLVEGIDLAPVLSEEDLKDIGFREMTQEEKAQKCDELFGNAAAFTQDDVLAKVDEHPKYLDHAFALLGKDPTDPQGARSRFARFVTGDFKDEGKNFRPKSLEHKTAFRCFYRFIKNTEYDSHIELARDIVAENWEDLEELLEAECYSLPKIDDVWLDRAVITNMSAKAFQVEGWGWVPKSKVKFIKGKMVIPSWLAQSILDKREEA